MQALAQQRRPNSARQLVSGMYCYCYHYFLCLHSLNDRLKKGILKPTQTHFVESINTS